MRYYLIILLSLFTISNTHAAPDNSQERFATKKSLTTKKIKIKSLKVNLQETKDETKQEILLFQTTEKKISNLALNKYQQQQQLKTINIELQALQKKTQQLQAKYQRNQIQLSSQLHTGAVLQQPHARLKLLLGQHSPQSIGRILTYHNYFHQDLQNKLSQGRQQLQDITNTRAQTLQQQASHKLTLQKLNANIAKLHQAQKKRNAILAKLRGSATKNKTRLDILQKDEALLLTKLKQITRRLARSKRSFRNAKRKLHRPSVGDMVHAIYPGKIIFADWLRGFGLLVIIDHSDGYMSLYGHNQTLFKKVGDWVDKGENIALIGQSGGQEKVGLYFEIRHNGKKVNTRKWYG